MTYFATQREDLAPRVVGLLGFDGVATLDLTGPLEALATARRDADESGAACYKPVVIGLTNKAFVSESGFVFRADQTIEKVAAIDTLIIPGGQGLRHPEKQSARGRLDRDASKTGASHRFCLHWHLCPRSERSARRPPCNHPLAICP